MNTPNTRTLYTHTYTLLQTQKFPKAETLGMEFPGYCGEGG